MPIVTLQTALSIKTVSLGFSGTKVSELPELEALLELSELDALAELLELAELDELAELLWPLLALETLLLSIVGLPKVALLRF